MTIHELEDRLAEARSTIADMKGEAISREAQLRETEQAEEALNAQVDELTQALREHNTYIKLADEYCAEAHRGPPQLGLDQKHAALVTFWARNR